jgi:LDH2 family malate/lactate/ureidoglycolate dehydrogenase
MATTTVAIGKVELAMRKEQRIPPGWGVDCDGIASTDPSKVFIGGGLLPIGGTVCIASFITLYIELNFVCVVSLFSVICVL